MIFCAILRWGGVEDYILQREGATTPSFRHSTWYLPEYVIVPVGGTTVYGVCTRINVETKTTRL